MTRPKLPLLLATMFAASALGACSEGVDLSEPDPLASSLASGRWIDLTHTLAEDSVFWPTAPDYEHEEVANGIAEGGYYYSSYNLHLSEHGGTHLDAPIHFAEGRQTADEIPLTSLIGPAAVIDVTEQASADRDYRVTVADIEGWEAEHGELPDGAILLIRTGFDRYWPDRQGYLGTVLRGEEGVAALNFPGIAEETAHFLVEYRDLAAVGIDTASLDHGPSTEFPAHRLLLGANIPGFENVANLGELPATGAMVIALPAKIAGGSGAPLRIVAHLPTQRGE